MRVNYSLGKPPRGDIERLPMLPVTLSYSGRTLEIIGLVDSGSMLNVLPYRVGVELGVLWDEQQANLTLGGSFGGVPAMPIVVTGQVGDFAPVNLLFAWSQSNDVRIILGQFNFFQEFVVTFFRSRFEFEVNPRQ
jgi:hypothetical protein